MSNAQFSPVSTTQTTPKQTDFAGAIRALVDGKTVTKLEWDNRETYLFMENEHLMLQKADGKKHTLIVSLGDMVGTDWVVRD